MKDVLRVEGLDILCSGMLDGTAVGYAEGGAIGIEYDILVEEGIENVEGADVLNVS